MITHGSVMNRPASFGQHCRIGKFIQTEVAFANHFFAAAGRNCFRKKIAHLGEHGQHFDFVEKSLRRFHVHELADAVGNIVERVDFERHAHAPLGTELIDEHGNLMAFGIFKQQRGAAGMSLGVAASLKRGR